MTQPHPQNKIFESFLLLFFIITLMAMFFWVILPFLIEYNAVSLPDSQCNSMNENENIWPVEIYRNLPAGCANTTRLYPDEERTVNNITYIYNELPELGYATLSTRYGSGDFIFFNYIFGNTGFRGEYVIRNVHNYFEQFTDERQTVTYNWSDEPIYIFNGTTTTSNSTMEVLS